MTFEERIQKEMDAALTMIGGEHGNAASSDQVNSPPEKQEINPEYEAGTAVYRSKDFEVSGVYGKSGVPIHPVHSVMDGSKIKRLMDCPRSFFFEHILGWQTEETNIHLIFGSAIHAALEVMYTLGEWHEGTALVKAMEAFTKVYTEETSKDEFFEPSEVKNPDQAMRLLISYAATYAADMNKYETLYTEVGGVVPITEDHSRLIAFNIDQVFKHLTGPKAGKIGYKEYKTTGRNTAAWRDAWSYAFQPGTYFYALAAHYGLENVGDCFVDGLVVRKPTKNNQNNFDFERFPIQKSGPQISAWISDANYWWDFLDWNLQLLCETDPDDPVMSAFPVNSASTAKFGSKHAPYLNKANPLRDIGIEPPIGYHRAFWDPTQREVVKHKLDLTQPDSAIVPVEQKEEL